MVRFEAKSPFWPVSFESLLPLSLTHTFRPTSKPCCPHFPIHLLISGPLLRLYYLLYNVNIMRQVGLPIIKIMIDVLMDLDSSGNIPGG